MIPTSSHTSVADLSIYREIVPAKERERKIQRERDRERGRERERARETAIEPSATPCFAGL